MVSAKILIAISSILISFLLVIYTAIKLTQPILPVSDNNSKIAFTHNLQQIYEASQSSLLNIVNNPYLLPYPGILPNHPLYWSKMIRDRVQLLTTKDPTKKMQLFLLFADKRLAAGQLLIATGDKGLGVSTITKAEKYLLSAYEIYRQYDDPEKKRYRQNLGDAFNRHLIYIDITKKQIGDEFKLDSLNQLEAAIKAIYDAQFQRLYQDVNTNLNPKEASSSTSIK